MKGKLLYSESHSMSGTIVWYLTLVSLVGIIGLFSWGMYVQLVTEVPWGSKPMSDTGLLIISSFSIIVSAAVSYFIGIHRLSVEMDSQHIYVRFAPYFRTQKVFKKEELQDLHVRQYRPIMEYGGWGLRYGLKNNKAYNISGNWGLQLVFANGSKLLLGTKQPEAMRAAVEKFKIDG